jgi:hypothetical protein
VSDNQPFLFVEFSHGGCSGRIMHGKGALATNFDQK